VTACAREIGRLGMKPVGATGLVAQHDRLLFGFCSGRGATGCARAEGWLFVSCAGCRLFGASVGDGQTSVGSSRPGDEIGCSQVGNPVLLIVVFLVFVVFGFHLDKREHSIQKMTTDVANHQIDPRLRFLRENHACSR
jgi:hypothetical protein